MKKKLWVFLLAVASVLSCGVALTSCGEEQAETFEEQGTEGLDYLPLPDNTYAVSQGKACYLEDIVIPATHNGKSVTVIVENAFTQSNLKSIVIPDSVTSIGYGAFYKCSGLTSIAIPDGVTSIGEAAFSGCSSLMEMTLPFVGATKDGTSDTHFGYIFGASSYSNNDDYVPTSLKKVTITSATSIGERAFYGCSSLTSVVIPDGVTSIGSSVFRSCSSLTSIEIPDGVGIPNLHPLKNNGVF